MKKIFYILASAIVALGAVACENDVMDNIATVEGDTVSFVAAIDDTKTDLTADNKTIWDDDDTISITWTDAKGERTDVFSNKETGDQNKFTCTADGLAAITEAEVVATYSHNGDGKIDSEAGKAGSLLAYSGAFTELKFQVQNAFLKFTAAEGVVLTATEGLLSEGTTFEVTAENAGEIYVAINPMENATISYTVNGEEGKSKTATFVAGKIYNLGALNTPVASDDKGNNYTDIATALTLAESGSTITLVADVELDAEHTGLTVASGKTLTLDLNGKTLSQTTVCTKSHILLNNNGILTIKDNSAEKTGAIILTDNGDGDSSFGWGSYAVRNNGTLTIDGGTIKCVKRAEVSHTAVALMLYAGKATINDGNIISTSYRSVQGFYTPEVIINGGNFEGQVWMHETCSDAASLTINGGTFAPRGNDGSSVFLNNTNDIKLSITGGTFTTKVGCNDATKSGVVGAITGGTYTEAAYTGGATKTLIAEGYVTVKDGENYVVTTFSKAFAMGDVTILLPEGEYDLTTASIDDKTITLQGASKQGTVVKLMNGAQPVTVGGKYNANITFEKLTFVHNVDAYGGVCANVETYNDCIYKGTLVTYSKEVNVNGTAFVPAETEGYNVHIYNDGACNFTNCTFTTTASRSVYAHAESTKVMDIKFENCTFETVEQLEAGDWRYHPAIRLHTESPSDISGTLTINNCEIVGGKTFGNVHNGGLWVEWNNTTKVPTYKFNTTVDGVSQMPVATVNGVAYKTWEEAIAAAKDGDTVTLTKEVELESSEILTIDKNITLEGNGATISSTAERAINVNTDGAVTIQNLTIVATGQRAVNVIQKPATVTLSGVNFTAGNYTVNVAASAGEAKVFIENSTLYGLNVVSVNGPGAEVTLTGCTVNCTSNAESYAALCLGKDAVGGSIEATDTTINVEEPSVKGRNNADGGTVTIDGSTADVDIQYAIIDYPDSYVYHSFATVDEAIEFNLSEYDGQHEITLLRDATVATVGTHKIDVNGHTLTAAEGYILTDNGEKSYTVVAAVAKVDTNYYATFDAALAAAEEGATIELLANIEGTVTLNKACVINTNGKTFDYTVATGFRATVDGNTITVVELVESVWSITGDNTGWATEKAGEIMMYQTDDANVFVAYNVTFDSTTASQGDSKDYNEFKIRKDNAWTTSYGVGACVKAGYKVGLLGRNTGIEEDGTYDIYFNSSTKQIAVMPVGKTWSDAVEPEFNDGNATCTWGIVGSMNGWGTPDVAMYWDGTYWYAKGVQFEANDQFKCRQNHAWNVWDYGGSNIQSATHMSDSDGNIKASAKCTYDVYVSKTAHKVWFKAAGERP